MGLASVQCCCGVLVPCVWHGGLLSDLGLIHMNFTDQSSQKERAGGPFNQSSAATQASDHQRTPVKHQHQAREGTTAHI